MVWVSSKVSEAGISPAALSIASLATEAKIATVVAISGTSVVVERSPYMVRTSFTLGQSSSVIADWAVKNGIDKDKFLAAYSSFSVLAKLRNAGRTATNYDVDSTPTLIVDGRYLTNPSMVDTSNPGIPGAGLGPATLQVVDALIAAARH